MGKLNLPKEVVFLIIMALFLIFGSFLPQTFVLAKGELFNEELTYSSNLFRWLLFTGIGICVFLYFAFFNWKKDDRYGNVSGVIGEGNFAGSRWWHKFDLLQRILLSWFFVGLIMLIATSFRKDSFTQLILLPQQFTATDSIIYSTFLTPFSENPLAMALIMILSFAITMVSIKYKVSKENHKFYLLLIIPLMVGLFAVLWHNTAYANSDYAKWVVFFFWYIGAFISVYFEDVFIFLFMHIFNNFFIDFTRLFTSDTALITVVIFVLGLPALIWIGIYGFKFTPSKQ